MKKYFQYILASILSAFGLLTLVLSTSVIFDMFDFRVKEGNYVLFVVWSNFISSILYLFAAYGFIKNKKWTSTLLWISTLILMAAFIGLKIHASSGGIYEEKTISAMIFRISVTLFFAIIAYLKIKKREIMKYVVFTNTKINKIILNKNIILSLIVFSLLLFSCNNTSNEKSKQQAETITHEERPHSDEMQTIEFNNGEKWKVDANMIKHIRNMENDIITFSNVKQKDYKSLSRKLRSNIELLTSNCTMKGKAHDELHKWLLPYIDIVKELSEFKNENDALKQFKNIQTSFTTFNQYFQ